MLHHKLIKTGNMVKLCFIIQSQAEGHILMAEVIDSLNFANTNLFQEHGIFLLYKTLPVASNELTLSAFICRFFVAKLYRRENAPLYFKML